MKVKIICCIIFLSLGCHICNAQPVTVNILNQAENIGTPVILKFEGMKGTNQINIIPKALRDVAPHSSTEALSLEIRTKTLKDQKTVTIPILVDKSGEFVLSITVTNEQGTKKGNIYILAENGKVALGRAISDAAALIQKGEKTSTWILGENYTEKYSKNLENWTAAREKQLIEAIENRVPVANLD